MPIRSRAELADPRAAVTTAAQRYWRLILLTALAVACVVLMPAAAARAGVPAAVDRCSSPVHSAPKLVLSPRSGPVGSTVTISGRVPRQDVKSWVCEWRFEGGRGFLSGLFARSRFASDAQLSSNGGCRLDVNTERWHWTFDPDTRRIRGSFRVGGVGSCEQSSGEPHRALAGTYALRWGTPEAGNNVAVFRITAADLPFTGSPTLAEASLGCLLLLFGCVICGLARRSRLKTGG